MTHLLQAGIRPTLFAILVASACSAMAAQRMDLSTINLDAPGFAAANVHSLSGLSADEMKPLNTTVVNGQNITRFQQYYSGVPVLGETIVVKGSGNASTSAPASLSGVVLRNLSQDLPSVRPTLDRKTVLEQAKTLSRTQQTSKEKVNLYIKQAGNGAAQLVYVVSFVNHSAPGASEPAYMIDATSGAVLDRWEGLDMADANGPGAVYKNALNTLSKTAGWNQQKARELLRFAQDIYLGANSDAKKGSCGAEQAALELGYKVADVRAAFRQVEKCRSSTVVELHGTTLAELSAPIEHIEYVNGNVNRLDDNGFAAKTSSTSSTLVSLAATKNAYGPWSRLTSTDLSRLGSHGVLDYAQNRFTAVIGSAPTRPVSVSFNDYKLGTAGQNPNPQFGWWVDKRFVGTGQISDIPNYNAWRGVSGYDIIVVPNYDSKPKALAEVLLYSKATTQATNWSVSSTASVKIGGKIGIPLVTEGSVEVSLSLTGTGGGSTSVTKTTNYYRPAITIPVGYEAVFQLVERWRPVSAVWSVPIEFSGLVGADYGPGKWNGHYYWALNASSYFYEYGNRAGAERYQINLNEKYQTELMVRGYVRPRTN